VVIFKTYLCSLNQFPTIVVVDCSRPESAPMSLSEGYPETDDVRFKKELDKGWLHTAVHHYKLKIGSQTAANNWFHYCTTKPQTLSQRRTEVQQANFWSARDQKLTQHSYASGDVGPILIVREGSRSYLLPVQRSIDTDLWLPLNYERKWLTKLL